MNDRLDGWIAPSLLPTPTRARLCIPPHLVAARIRHCRAIAAHPRGVAQSIIPRFYSGHPLHVSVSMLPFASWT